MSQKRLTTLVYFWAFISLGLIAGLLGPSLPSFAENTGSTLRQLSNLFILSALGYLLGSYLAGQLLSKISGHKIMLAALIFIGLGTALLPVIRSLWVLVILFFIIGLAQSNLDVSENTLLIWLHGKAVPPYMNGLHFFFGLGSFIAPFFIAQSIRLTNSLNTAFWVMAVIMLVPVFLILRLPSPTAPVINSQSSAESKYRTPTLLVVLLVLFFFGFVGAEVTFGTWIYTYTLENGFGDAVQSAYLTSAFWGAFTIARLVNVVFSRWISVTNMLWITLSGSLISLSLLIFWPDSKIALWIAILGFGFFIATIFPTAMNFAESLNAVSSKVTSLFFVSASLSSMFSPWIVGQWFASRGPQVMVFVVIGNILLGLIFYSIIRSYQKRLLAWTRH